jgi:Zn-dependent M28 family amino/carboxypeptidase
MIIINSSKTAAKAVSIANLELLTQITEKDLKKTVEKIAIPRHFKSNAKNNREIAEFIFSELSGYGYKTEFQGKYSNVVAVNPNSGSSKTMLVGAHYDSVPQCPGADDNASAVTALLVCAKIILKIAPEIPICFAAFNGEEDGLLGSYDFVLNFLGKSKMTLDEVHILEMIGYSTDEPETQSMPKGLPVKIPSVGNFLGILGNQDSRHLVDEVVVLGKSYLPELSVLGLKILLGIEKLLPDLGRSDHLPFWAEKIPALMWTDTADFRNPHYHRGSDTPETLNYGFLKQVTQLLLLKILGK